MFVKGGGTHTHIHNIYHYICFGKSFVFFGKSDKQLNLENVNLNEKTCIGIIVPKGDKC